MDRREHHRVQLRLPTRLRWTTPFGQKAELCDTVNVSRGGLLVPCQETHAEGMSLWVTFPYDASIAYGQPEILAKVVRSFEPWSLGDKGAHGNGANGAAITTAVAMVPPDSASRGSRVSQSAALSSTRCIPATLAALRFEIAPRRHSNGNGNGHKREHERRATARQRLAVPVRVRPELVPWFEETMTVDCSPEGLKFRSNREYGAGDFLMVSFESADTSPWPGLAQLIMMVVRIEREPLSPVLSVAVCRSQQFCFRF